MSSTTPTPQPPTTVTEAKRRGIPRSVIDGPAGRITRVGIGEKRGDFYHVLMRSTWPRFLGAIVLAYLLINLGFAILYLLIGGLENAQAGSLLDCFFFSVQTLGTIGYGKISPVTVLANSVVTVESLTGMLGVALVTGLIFAKFARPTARVMWAKVCVVARREGVPSLMFRMANERSNQIVDATFRLTVLVDETTVEGERLRRLHDLALMRNSTPTFTLTFTAVHRITPESILYGKTREDLEKMNAQFIFTISGMDDTMNATVHARKAYTQADVRWNMRFVDILSALRDGARVVDYTRFDEVEPDAAK